MSEREDRELLRWLYSRSGSPDTFKQWRVKQIQEMLQLKRRRSTEEALKVELAKQNEASQWNNLWQEAVQKEAECDRQWYQYHTQEKARWHADWEQKRAWEDRTDLDELLDKLPHSATEPSAKRQRS